eukprot:3376690-Lingulodinium_polyedra.AAC.1
MSGVLPRPRRARRSQRVGLTVPVVQACCMASVWRAQRGRARQARGVQLRRRARARCAVRARFASSAA